MLGSTISNVFRPKKKEPQMSVAPTQSSQMSTTPKLGYSPTQSQSTNMSYASQPAVIKKSTQVATDPNQRIVGLLKAGTTLPQAPKMPSFRKPQMSTAPQMSFAKPKVQASGMGGQYANNIGNKPMTPAPRVAAPVQQDAAPQADPQSDWMKYVMGTGERQKSLAEQQRDATMDYLKQQGQLTNEQLMGQIPAAQEGFNQFKGNTEATIADLIAGGEMQKSQTSDYYGDAQRQSAQTLRETHGQQQRTFANLGTLDSRGEGSFSQANTNVMSDFNRTTQQNLKAKADKLTEIDMNVRTAERSARQAIVQEEQKLKQLESDIRYAVANNDLETASGLKQAYLQSQQLIYDIEDSMAETKYAFALEQQSLQNEMAKIQSFSPEFMQTGQPTNQAEYEFFVKNKDAMSGLYGSNGMSDSNKKAANIIDQLLNTATQGITGKMRFGFTDESRAAEGLLKQISSELQIEEAKRLKGQGAMSDAERAILANSIAAFNLDSNGRPNVSDERFKQILSELKSGFSGQSSTGSSMIRVRQNSTGQTGSIPVSEFNPQEYTQI